MSLCLASMHKLVGMSFPEQKLEYDFSTMVTTDQMAQEGDVIVDMTQQGPVESNIGTDP